MMGKKMAAGALVLAAAALVLGVGVAAAADEDGKEQGVRVTTEQAEATRPPTRIAPAPVLDGKDQ
jgi:hypothetical protein